MMKANNYLAVWCDSCHQPAPGYQQTHSNKGAGKVLRQAQTSAHLLCDEEISELLLTSLVSPQHQQSLQPLRGYKVQGSSLG